MSREPTDEELAASFDESIENMQLLVRNAVAQGQGAMVSPIVMVIMRTLPNFEGTPIEYKPFQPGSGGHPVQVGVFSPLTLTPPGMPQMPKNIFWHVMKRLAEQTRAYAIIVGMEAWIVHAKSPEEVIPKSLADHPDRGEALLVTAERKGERRLYHALMRREGDKLSFDPWALEDASMKLEGSVFQDVLNPSMMN